jgi:hypothetical protein
MQGNVQKETSKEEQILSLVKNAIKRDTMQVDAQRKVP